MTDVSRRGIIGASLGVAAAATATTASAAIETARVAAPAINRRLPDVAVIGAGVFGVWTALCLREKGARVTLIDAYGPGNALQTSGDETRQIRCSYGAQEVYTRWARRAFTLWQEREAEFKRGMIFPNGVLILKRPEERRAVEQEIFNRLGIPHEILSQAELRSRWPQAHFDDIDEALYEPEAGTIKSRESIIAAGEVFQQKGGEVRIGAGAPGEAQGGSLANISLTGGGSFSAGMYVFACGPWLPRVLPDVLTNYIRVSRSEVFYFGSPPGDPSYNWRNLPNMYEVGPSALAYTMADINYGYKVVPRFTAPIDPSVDDRIASSYLIRRAREYLELRLPGLADQPLVASRVCSLENSNNHYYIIDKHPAYDNVWIAGAGSGGAAKMGPQLGDYVSDRVLDRPDDPAVRELFALTTHAPVPS